MKPSDAEIDANPRSQSAVMRVARRLPFPETVFFFQAEDGIRGIGVTGVQTCALPIFGGPATNGTPTGPAGPVGPMGPRFPVEIGRASCRERVYISVVAVSLKKKIFHIQYFREQVDGVNDQRGKLRQPKRGK